METHENQMNIFERLNQWIKESITVKLVSIGFLVLILLIPSAWINNLIEERQTRAEDVVQEVSEKWSGSQTLSGPIMVIPYKAFEKVDHGKDGVTILEHQEKYYFLPETLDVNGQVNPEELHRGIFDVAVYTSAMTIKANFLKPNFESLNIAPENIQWNEAYMIFGITDLRGISDNPNFLAGDSSLSTEPSSNVGVSVKKYLKSYLDQPNPGETSVFSSNGIIAKLNWKSAEDFQGNTSIKLNLKGSQKLSFVPTGKTTTVKVEGNWASPSFDGEFLPESREISDDSFKASWKVLHYNRPFSQQWTSNNETLSGSDFGVRLFIPVDQYQKSIRTAKYGVLIIILTFVALFLVEITKGIRIHPFQYILIGVSLIIYYTLLLSLSEQVGYNFAYWISTAATVSLISFYSYSFLRTSNLTILFTVLLGIFYSFIFVIILQQDFSLLLGSIGLFLIVGSLMYFSRKIEWYKEAKA